MLPRLSNAKGLTLIELLVALAIIAIALRWASASYSEHIEKTRVYDAVMDIGTLAGTIELFIADTGRAPTDLSEVNSAGLLDPWGFEYRYNPNMNQKGNGGKRKDRSLNPLNTDFDLYSVGKDGETSQSLMPSASDDDVIRANDGGYIGLAEKY